MRKFPWETKLLFFTITCFFITALKGYAQFTTINYNGSTDDIMNPDRGFYFPYDTEYWYDTPGNYLPLNESVLRQRRVNAPFTPDPQNGNIAQYNVNTSIIARHFILDDFVTSNISNAFLNKIQTDFNSARNAGVRIVLRFSYTISPNSGNCNEGFICRPYGDASKFWVLRHIEQLKPLLQDNEDVIMVLQSGFIGMWGEQYYTDHFGDASSNGQGYLNTTNWNDRIDVLKALLDAVPQSRMVQVRYPQMRQKFVARHPELANRIGFQNDCFLSSETDVGTYVGYDNNDPTSTNSLRDFANVKGDFVAVGGETCGNYFSGSNNNNCAYAVPEMQRMNWSFLNSAYNYEVNNKWANDCIYDIKTRLGYRFVLKNGEYPIVQQTGSNVYFNLNVENKGFAAPFNKRKLYMILKNGATYLNPIEIFGGDSDITTWRSGNHNLTLNFKLPDNIALGNYEMYLHIADLSNGGRIRNNPAYSIRLANKLQNGQDVWDAVRGYNNLNHTISIQNTQPEPEPPISNNCIDIDDNLSDWHNIVGLSTANNPELSALKVADDDHYIYIHLAGTLRNHYQIFLDTDGNRNVSNNNDREYLNSDWPQTGFNYMVENGTLVRHFSDNPWSWPVIGSIQQSETNGGLELVVPKNLLVGLSNSIIYVAANTLNANWVGTAYLPAASTVGARYELFSSNPCVEEDVCILIDGNISDWQDISITHTNNGALNRLKVADNTRDLFLLIEGSPNLNNHTPQLFFDTNNNQSNEFTATHWGNTGFNYMMEYNTFYKYVGDGNSWNWQNLGEVERNYNNVNVLEVKIPKSKFQETISTNIKVAGSYKDSNWNDANKLLPSSGTTGINYTINNNTCNGVVQKTVNENHTGLPAKYNLEASQVFKNGETSNKNYNKGLNQNCMAVDGSPNEWEAMGTYGYGASGSLTHIKVADNNDEILFYLEGGLDVNNQIYLNSDVNNATLNRYNLSQWQYTGFNYLIENEALYVYNGDGESWSWSPAGTISHSISDNVLEIVVQKSQLANLSNSIGFAATSLNTDWLETGAIPQSNAALNYLSGTKNLCNIKPACLTVNGDLEQWQNLNDAAKQINSNHLQSIKISDGSESLYVLLEGKMDVYQQIFIDSDNDAVGANEYTDSNWSLTGFNYLVDEGDLFIYQGDGTSWDWLPIGAVNMITSKYWVELSIKKYLMGNITGEIQVAASSFNADWAETSFLPQAEQATVYKPSTNNLSLFFHQNGINYHQAYSVLESSANLLNSSTNEVYKAGQLIQLNSGFISPPLTNFDAYIQECE